jgi:hypothetical protein
MDERYSATEWIAAYLEWAGAAREARDAGSIDPAPAAAEEDGIEFARAYFEWMDARRTEAAPKPEPSVAATREAILLAALRTESDCIRVLRRVLDAGEASPRAVGLACEAIEYAELLLKDARLLSVRV